MDMPHDPDANITLPMGAAEAEWYQAGLTKRKLSARPIEVPRLVARRVRRISDGVRILRTLFPQPGAVPALMR